MGVMSEMEESAVIRLMSTRGRRACRATVLRRTGTGRASATGVTEKTGSADAHGVSAAPLSSIAAADGTAARAAAGGAAAVGSDVLYRWARIARSAKLTFPS